MRFFFILFILYLPLLSKGQDTTIFAPSGSTFYYSTWFPPGPELLTFVSDGDTILNGIQSRILKFYKTENGNLMEVPELEKYVYTSGNQVFYLVQDDFYLLYDFSAQPGDIIHSRVEDFPHSLSCFTNFDEGPFDFSYIIDSVGIMTVDGIDLRFQHAGPIFSGSDHEWLIDGLIIERIGTYSISNFWWGRGANCALGGIPGELRCYTDQDIYFKNESAHFDLPCDYVSATYNISDNSKNIFPNPTSDVIELSAVAELYIIHDLFGRKISEGRNESIISLHDLPSNIYIINYKIENYWITEKIIKK